MFDVMEELDAVGPWEVFAWWTRHYPADGYAVTTFSADGGPVRCEKGLVINAHHGMADLPPLEVLLYPGGDGTVSLRENPGHLDWLRGMRDRTPLVTSVCTGATVLAAAGLLSGRPATTNRNAFEEVARLDPTAVLRRGERFVDDGDIITSAGISAGLDMALHIVGRLASPARAGEVREGIEYGSKVAG